KRNASFYSLSGGQKQRLFLTLALVNNPQLVFLDEMTTGLDPAGRRSAWDLIKSIRDRGKTVVLVTHFMDEAEILCDRLAIIDHGRVIAMDTPSGLINKYAPNIKVTFTTDHKDLSWLKQISQVQNISKSGTHITIEGWGPVLALVASELVKHNIIPSDLRVKQSSLEDVFLTLTGKEGNL
ncbi:MAG: ABC transporter ATP-binding protein, partial [Chloroflexi bacterium]|nr:ABC transporter ATP-binding protein [Chloroflexota bacterium]